MAEAREWSPANDVEVALLRASNDGDQRAYFQILAQAPLYLPASAEAQRRGAPKLYSWDSDGVRIVPVYTSLEALAHGAGEIADAYAVTTYPELAANWPDPAWKLAVNPQLSIGVYVSIDDIALGARGELAVPSAAELLTAAVTDVVPANPVEESLRAARLTGDLQAYVQAVVVSDVLVPTTRAVLDPDEISGAHFPWWSLPGRPDRSIPVFSSAERMAEGLPDAADSVLVPFIAVAEFWPGPAYTMVINADTALELTLSGDSVRQLFDAMRAELTGEPSGIASALPPGAATLPARGDPSEPPPLVELQKVIAHADVFGYLRDGRHLVTGFVYPADGLRHLTTPAALYAGLGLLYDGSPFRQTDKQVHVLRWLAHCPMLYRLALGGPDEATRLANRGWMVEPAPFRGTGVSAGDAQVSQLKVDSVEVPHGAVLVRLASSGAETVVASFDADFASWLPVAPVDLGAMLGPS